MLVFLAAGYLWFKLCGVQCLSRHAKLDASGDVCALPIGYDLLGAWMDGLADLWNQCFLSGCSAVDAKKSSTLRPRSTPKSSTLHIQKAIP